MVGLNHPDMVRLDEHSIQAVKNTWSGRFQPYLDQSQWPEYHGVQLWPDPSTKVVGRGRRQTKRFRGDMDDWAGGYRREWGSEYFTEPRDKTRCGECNADGHNKTS